jgi:hypothetical protein
MRVFEWAPPAASWAEAAMVIRPRRTALKEVVRKFIFMMMGW